MSKAIETWFNSATFSVACLASAAKASAITKSVGNNIFTPLASALASKVLANSILSSSTKDLPIL